MDTPQPPPIVNQVLKRKERSPSPARRTPGHTSTAGSRPSPTSLPSIRHFLPQPDTAQLNERYHLTNNRQQTGPAFSAGPSAGIPRLDFLPPSPAQPPAERTHSGIIGDSDGDGDSEQAARPKQKRRRQALSCTECKRRKIKCDRAHPCTPCIRRGDQNKCQWHVIEPVDKYVSRAEYDELKARVDHLETLLHSRPQLLSGFAPQPQHGPEPTSSSQAQPKPVGSPSTRLLAAAAPGQQQGCGAISTVPAPVPMPIMPYNPIGLPKPPNSSPVGRTPSTTTATTTTTLTTLPSIASLANGPPLHPTGAARLHREHREQQHQPYAPLPPPQSPLQQQQSLQLQMQQLRMQRMHQDKQQQTKKCHAQTFTPLGERLRCHHRIFLQGPAAVYRLYRLPNNNSNNSNIHRRLRRIIMRGARRGSRTRVPTCRGRPHPERQRSGVQPVRRRENGSRVPIYPWLWTRRNRALGR